MRDLIWSLIIVWLIIKVVEIFKGSSAKKNVSAGPELHHNHRATPPPTEKKGGRSERISDNEGEYVDFEEIR
jgi:hypothetical protein